MPPVLAAASLVRENDNRGQTWDAVSAVLSLISVRALTWPTSVSGIVRGSFCTDGFFGVSSPQHHRDRATERSRWVSNHIPAEYLSGIRYFHRTNSAPSQDTRYPELACRGRKKPCSSHEHHLLSPRTTMKCQVGVPGGEHESRYTRTTQPE